MISGEHHEKCDKRTKYFSVTEASSEPLSFTPGGECFKSNNIFQLYVI